MTVCHSELPDWMQDNIYLKSGHRPATASFKKCFRSMFQIHTETGTIWAHFVGMILFVVAAIVLLLTRDISSWRWEAIVVYSLFFVGAITCFTFSWMFHLFACHSEKVKDRFLTLDYIGIAIILTTSFVSLIYFEFYCKETERIVYISVNCAFIVLAALTVMNKKFSAPNCRPVRGGLWNLTGLTGAVSTVHFFIMEDVDFIVEDGLLYIMIASALVGALAAVVYMTMIPERLYPGKFDIVGHSHQLFHVGVLVSVILLFFAVDILARSRASEAC